MPRKIIQIDSCVDDECLYINTLCNDGTIWRLLDDFEWERLPAIPQDGYVEPDDLYDNEKSFSLEEIAEMAEGIGFWYESNYARKAPDCATGRQAVKNMNLSDPPQDEILNNEKHGEDPVVNKLGD